jgi:hypothetical protein
MTYLIRGTALMTGTYQCAVDPSTELVQLEHAQVWETARDYEQVLFANSPVSVRPDVVNGVLLVVLHVADAKQVLREIGEAEQLIDLELLHAGDLDRDGRVDVLVDVVTRLPSMLATRKHTLFLSAGAGPAELVRGGPSLEYRRTTYAPASPLP